MPYNTFLYTPRIELEAYMEVGQRQGMIIFIIPWSGVHVSFSVETEVETKTGDKLVSLVSYVSF